MRTRLFVFFAGVGASDILYVAPFPSISHYQMMEPLMLRLAERGHRVTVLSHYPRRHPVPNYRDVDLRGTVPSYQLNFTSWGFLDDVLDLFRIGSAQCESLVSSPVVQTFLREDLSFDLVLLEMMDSECYLGFPLRYRTPWILVTSLPLTVWHADWLHNPTESTHVPDPLCRVGGRLDFVGRMQNVLCQGFLRVLNYVYSTRGSIGVVERYFPNANVPNLDGVKSNLSLVFANTHPSFAPPRSLHRKVIEVGGIHIRPVNSLPTGIDKFLSDSGDAGAILFSMGSMVRADTLDADGRAVFVTAFGRLRERVLCKWESRLDEAPPNVMVVDWLPQSDVLGHPRVKLFISHGGIHGVMESVRSGVPVLGIPLYGDQRSNLMNLESSGAALVLDLTTLTVDNLVSAIEEMINNPKYERNAKRLSAVMRDRPVSPLDLATFWTEHVLRHGPLPTPSPTLAWWQYFMLDVVAVWSIVALTSALLTYRMSLRLLSSIHLIFPSPINGLFDIVKMT